MFNLAHAHLLMNHLPVVGALIGLLLLLIAMVRRSAEMTRAGLIVLVLAAVSAIPTYLTGESAAHIVKGLPGVEGALIHDHAEAAQWGLVILELTGLVSLFGLARYWKAEVFPRAFAAIVLLLAIFASAVMGRTALAGGMIRHTEIRSEAPATPGEVGN